MKKCKVILMTIAVLLLAELFLGIVLIRFDVIYVGFGKQEPQSISLEDTEASSSTTEEPTTTTSEEELTEESLEDPEATTSASASQDGKKTTAKKTTKKTTTTTKKAENGDNDGEWIDGWF